MKTYTFNTYEFAMLFAALQETVQFTHAFERTEAELVAFKKRCFPLISHANYDIIATRISDSQREFISDMPVETQRGDLSEQIEYFINAFSNE